MNPNSNESPEESIIRREESDSLLNAIDQLDPLDARIVRMRNFDSLSNKDVAKQLGVSVGSVYISRSRIVARLKNKVNEIIDQED